MAGHHPLHPSACFRSDPRSLPSEADAFGTCSLLALKAQALRRSKGSRNDLIGFPLIFFFFHSLHLQRQEEKIQPHTHVLLSWTHELVGGQPSAQGDLHSHKHALSTPLLPQEWRSCSCTDPPRSRGRQAGSPAEPPCVTGPCALILFAHQNLRRGEFAPGRARGAEPPSFAGALQVQRRPLATVT